MVLHWKQSNERDVGMDDLVDSSIYKDFAKMTQDLISSNLLPKEAIGFCESNGKVKPFAYAFGGGERPLASERGENEHPVSGKDWTE